MYPLNYFGETTTRISTSSAFLTETCFHCFWLDMAQVIFIFYLLGHTVDDRDDNSTTQHPFSFLENMEQGNSFLALLWGTFAASLFTMMFYVLQWYKPDGTLAWPNYKTMYRYVCQTEPSHDRFIVDEMKDEEKNDHTHSMPHDDAKPLLTLPMAVDSFLYGMGRIFPAMILLTLAWAVGRIMVDVGTDRLFSRWIVGGLPVGLLPTFSFVISCIMSLAMGTSWGAMTILFPLLLVPTYEVSQGNDILFYSTVAGILSGSVVGDNMSPISDTTVLSALACDCQLLRHVSTQAPYVMVVMLISILVGTWPIGTQNHAWPNWISILMGCVVVVFFSYFVCIPVVSRTGQYDIMTELRIRFFPNSELLELRENTQKLYVGEVGEASLWSEKNELDDNDDDMLTEETEHCSHTSEDMA